MDDFDGFNCKHVLLYHYTDEEGYNGILSSQSIRPSTIDGIKNTHYGRGVYLSSIAPDEMFLFGHAEFLRRVFGDVTTYSVSHTKYCFQLNVDPNWYAEAARDPEYGHWVKDIWIVPGDEDMDISTSLYEHGITPIGQEVAQMENPSTAERDYAYQLNRPAEPVQQGAAPRWKPSQYAFIGGQTVVRPEGWYEDAPHWWVPPEQRGSADAQ